MSVWTYKGWDFMMAFVSPSGKQLCFSLVHRFWTSLVHLEQQNPPSPAPLTKGKSTSVKFRERSNPRFLTYCTIKKEIWGKRGLILQSLCSASPTNPNPHATWQNLRGLAEKNVTISPNPGVFTWLRRLEAVIAADYVPSLNTCACVL